MLLWSDKLLHGVEKSRLDAEVGYGCYIGYFAAGSRERYAEVCGMDERVDRIQSYQEGCAPQLWPSFDPIHFYPKRFKNFPNLLQCYINKMPAGHPSITTRVTGKGKTVAHLEPWKEAAYTPPELSALGRKLLGLDDYPVPSLAKII
jgi:hypothetical protein